MTENQIEQLNIILGNSQPADNSNELDQRILASAHQAARVASLRAELSRNPAILSGLFSGMASIPFFRSATLAVVLTLGLLLGMGRMISVEEKSTIVKDSTLESQISVSNGIAKQATPGRKAMRQNAITIEPLPTGVSRDQILMKFELADTEALISSWPAEFGENPAATDNTMEMALLDINALIQSGALENARRRYKELISECSECSLPDTLEALVIATKEFSTADHLRKTG